MFTINRILRRGAKMQHLPQWQYIILDLTEEQSPIILREAEAEGEEK
jgi:hypothetical protein